MLADVLRERKDNLLESAADEIDNKKNINSKLKIVDNFLSKVEEDLYSIRTLNVSPILELLYDKDRIKEAERKIRDINIILVGKIDRGLLELDITEEQKEFLNELVEEVKLLKEDFIKEKENFETSTNKKKVDSYDSMLTKLENNESFDSNDYVILESILKNEDIPIDERIKLAKEILNHNKKESIKIVKTDIKDIISLFESYDFSDTEKEKLIKLINKHKKELETSFDLDNAKEILDYLCYENKEQNKVDILRRFEKESLLTIATYSNLDVVKKRYNELLGESIGIYKQEAGFWCDSENEVVSSKRKSGKRGKSKEERRYINEHALRIKSKSCNYYNSKKNEEFFKEKGLNYDFSNEKNKRALLTPHHIVKNNYEALVEYGILAKYEKRNENHLIPSSVFAVSGILEKCDKLIEVGLLNPEIEDTEEKTNYVVNNPSAIANSSEGAFLKLSVQKLLCADDMDFYRLLFGVKSSTGELNKTFIGGFLNYGRELLVDNMMEKYKANNSMVEYKDKNENFDLLVKELGKVDNYNMSTDDDFIRELDEKFGSINNKYVYKIGKQTISRLKVIRNYNSLKNSNKFNDKDIKLFSLLYGSYVNKGTYRFIENMLSEKMEENYGISR